MEFIVEAKKKGLVRHIGVTGHVSAEANRKALEYFDQGRKFETFQFPINPIDFHQKSFQRELLPEVVKRGIGVLAMKTSAAGALLREKACTIPECLRYVLSLPVSIAIVGMETVDQVRQNAGIVRRFQAMSAEETETLLDRIESRKSLDLEWYKPR